MRYGNQATFSSPTGRPHAPQNPLMTRAFGCGGHWPSNDAALRDRGIAGTSGTTGTGGGGTGACTGAGAAARFLGLPRAMFGGGGSP